MGFRQRRIRFELHHFRAQCRICTRGRTRLKEAFGAIGSAGGHGSMAKAIIPLGTQTIRQMDKKVQQLFLHALHSTR